MAAIVILAALFPLAPLIFTGDVPSFRDHEDYFVPLRAFTAEALRAGELPLWNPYSASGEPWLANPQTGVFYPPAWLVAILPFETGYVVFLVVHLAVLGLGLRRLFAFWSSDAAATLLSSALVVAGPILSLLDVSNNLATFAWTPWLLARALDREKSSGIADSVLLALSFLGGEPLLAAVTWLAWAGIRVATLGRAAIAGVAWRLFTAVALCAVQLFPFVDLFAGSDRAAGLDPQVAFRNSLSTVDWLAVIVSPAGVQPGIGRSQMFLPSIYLSPLVVFLALASMAGGAGRRARIGWLVVLAGAALLASGNQFPPAAKLFEWMQLTVNRYPAKFALFGFVAIGALGAIGFDRLPSLTTRARVACGLGAAALVACAHLVHRSSFAPVALAGLALGVFWVAGFWALLRYSPRVVPDARLVLVLVLLPVVVVESVAASRFLLVAGPGRARGPFDGVLESGHRVMRLELLDARWRGSAHVRDRSAWMGGYLNLLSRQPDASTAAPVIDRRYQELHDAALSGRLTGVLDFLSVRYLLTERDLSSYGYPRIASHAGVSVFERPGALPMLTADFAPRLVRDESEALEELVKPGATSTRPSILATKLRQTYPPDPPRGGEMRALALSFSLSSVRAEVELSHPALLVLNQRHAAGWSVAVDGARRDTVAANGLFRGVEVDPGRHEVVWSYRPRSLLAGMFVSLVAILSLALEWRRVRAIHEKKSRSFQTAHA
jgi:hypothetical protein